MAVAPANTAADQALVTFKVKKPWHASPEPKDVVEELKKEQAKKQISTTSNKASVNSVKPPTKPTPAQKPTKKVPVQKGPVQRSTAKGKEKAKYTPSLKSTSVLAKQTL
ncbi:hypothetical protein K443DRAFT_6852 [Laccaria amethystina LaAM-08-1]|uniref:Uncharacterized protein n=1 Tax=Laccaria amethystina LaAM-08-1 TaxID=1095629 RepID=A0A0C9Y0B5_9AGAR|nr:hypothetical protein K443DRAFT_6852 [Laccaria amethystina LaAM-08-1]